jgi:hypothetical protein
MGFIVREGVLQRGTPERELKPIATYKIEVDIGE